MKKCFIFAHYDKNNEIKSYIIDEINLLNELGDVLFISDCEYLSNIKDLLKVKYLQISRHLLYDAHSYICGYNFLRFSKQLNYYDSITFVNSSIIFPTCDKESFVNSLTKMDLEKESVYGMCKSRYLLQSYWITCKQKTYEYINTFFDNYIPATFEYVNEWWKENENKHKILIRFKNSFEKRKIEVGEELAKKWMYTVVNFEHGFSIYLYRKGFTLIALDYCNWPKSRFITKAPR